MFCPECGNPLRDGQKFCPECGTPVEGNERQMDVETVEVGAFETNAEASYGDGFQTNMETSYGDGFQTNTETSYTDTFQTDVGTSGEGAGTWQTTGMPTSEKTSFSGSSGTGTGNVKSNNLDMVMRIVCGVLAVIFLGATVRRIPGLFTTLFGLRLGYFIAVLFGFVASLVMCLSTAAAAWKWSSKLKDLVFGGAILSVVLRLLSLIIQMIANLIQYRVFIDGIAFLYWFGYVAVAVVLFVLMSVMGCTPILGETKNGVLSSINEGFSELTGAAKNVKRQQAEKNAARGQNMAAGYQAPPAGGAGYQTPPPANGGAPGYGVPPVSYGMPTTPPRGLIAKKTDRSLLMYILLSIVTCGIYPYFFIYNLAKDVNDLCEGDGESTSGLLTFILLGIVTCGIYTIIWWYKLANRLQANGPRYNVSIQENGTTYIMWVLFGALLCGIGPFIALNFVIKNTNKLCTVYNQYNGLR